MRFMVRGAERLVQERFSPDGNVRCQGMIPPVNGPGPEGPQVYAAARIDHGHKSPQNNTVEVVVRRCRSTPH